MLEDITIFVCDDEEKADFARGLLDGQGFGDITQDEVAHLLYDAKTHGDGLKQHRVAKWVVIGRK